MVWIDNGPTTKLVIWQIYGNLRTHIMKMKNQITAKEITMKLFLITLNGDCPAVACIPPTNPSTLFVFKTSTANQVKKIVSKKTLKKY